MLQIEIVHLYECKEHKKFKANRNKKKISVITLPTSSHCNLEMGMAVGVAKS